MTEFLVGSVWPGVMLCAVLYTADGLMTLATARQYATSGKGKIRLEGSFELNPLFQREVDSGRLLTGKWLVVLVVLSSLVAVLWYLTSLGGSAELYLFVLGGMLFLHLAVQTRHVRNWVLFSTALGEDGIRGQLDYPRWVVLSQSSLEFLSFAVVYAIGYAASRSVFLAGGAVACLGVALQHYLLFRRARKGVPSRPTTRRS